MVEIIYKWDNISIIVPTPSCISCIQCGSTSIDENDCVCLRTNKHHALTDRCDSYHMDTLSNRINK